MNCKKGSVHKVNHQLSCICCHKCALVLPGLSWQVRTMLSTSTFCCVGEKSFLQKDKGIFLKDKYPFLFYFKLCIKCCFSW